MGLYRSKEFRFVGEGIMGWNGTNDCFRDIQYYIYRMTRSAVCMHACFQMKHQAHYGAAMAAVAATPTSSL